MEAEENRTVVRKALASNCPFVRRVMQYEIADVNALRYVGKSPDLTPDELWQEDRPLTLDETLIMLKVNRLKRLYIDNEMYEIMECSVKKHPHNEEAYWEFVLELTKMIEQLGSEYVNSILRPLGFRQENYLITKQVR